MSEDKVIAINLNPFVFFEASDFGPGKSQELTCQDVLNYLANNNEVIPVAKIKQNYQTIGKKAASFVGLPAEAKILNKLVFPLKHAIGYYIMGHYLESIALCGFVAEMATIFKFQIHGVSFLEKPIVTEADEKANIDDVEWRKHNERIRKLLKDGKIDAALACKLDFVSKKRNRYLHSISVDDTNINEVARSVIDNTIDILRGIFNLRVGEGKILIDQKVLDYLDKKGLSG